MKDLRRTLEEGWAGKNTMRDKILSTSGADERIFKSRRFLRVKTGNSKKGSKEGHLKINSPEHVGKEGERRSEQRDLRQDQTPTITIGESPKLNPSLERIWNGGG